MSKDFAAQLADRWSVQVLDPRRPGVRAAIEGAVRQAIQTLGLPNGNGKTDEEDGRRRLHIFGEIVTERQRQNVLFPNELTLPYVLEPSGGRKTWETIARHACDRAQREGRLTHDHILDEETAECLAAETRADKRKEAVQAAASFVKLIEQIDREIEEEKSRG